MAKHFTMPTIIGTLDCTHQELNKSQQYGDEYINSKGYASLSIQITCNANEVFTSVHTEWPGTVHDARIWQ